jgi:hypothetical protein
MWKAKQRNADSADDWNGEETWSHTETGAEVPRDQTADAVFWDMGLILAVTLSIALAVNVALVALHIG